MTASATHKHYNLAPPLQEIDDAIAAIQEGAVRAATAQQWKSRILVCLASMVGSDETDIKRASKHLEEALSKPSDIREPGPLLASLLRILGQDDCGWVNEYPWRPRLITFFDVHGQDIYRDRKIEPGEQSHVKLSKLAVAVKEQEAALQSAFAELTSLDRLASHRRKLFAALNSRLGKVLLRPFLPPTIEAELGDLYSRVQAYVDEREEIGAADYFKRAVEQAGHFSQYLTTWGSVHARAVKVGVPDPIAALLKQDFGTNRAALPAALYVNAREKKYPFHQATDAIKVGVVLRNAGPGFAYGVRLSCAAEDCLQLTTTEALLGRIVPGEEQLLEFPAIVTDARDQTALIVQVDWSDLDGSPRQVVEAFDLKAQAPDIDWEAQASEDPYSLEPVSSEQQLVGRRELLNRLKATTLSPTVGSAIIRGQKRVGKTSIAQALRSHLVAAGYLVIYLEGGQYVDPSAETTVARLGTKICREILLNEPTLRQDLFRVPPFTNALGPLADFLDDTRTVLGGKRIVVILDEFDELPIELYTRGALGDAFFLTLRGITSRNGVGVVLVGGEKMEHVLDCQGDQLNKWNVRQVDYFANGPDYRELVQRPTAGILEFTADAISHLHRETAGNPSFTKLVCQRVFEDAVSQRDSHVTPIEVERAVRRTVEEVDRNTFQHFWEDGILETGARATAKSVARRKILIALSDSLAGQVGAPVKAVEGQRLVHDVVGVKSELNEFVGRGILVARGQGDSYDFKVPLFRRWLSSRGVHEVITSMADLDAAAEERQRQEQAKVQSREIVDLSRRWGNYKGQPMSEDRIRAWLGQFSDIDEQRLMFMILEHLRFYSNRFVRQKLSEADDIVKRGLVRRVSGPGEPRKMKRSEVLVSYLDGAGKSGAEFARLYADETNTYADNVVEKGRLGESLEKLGDVKTIVFLDDFVGTGSTAATYLESVRRELESALPSRQLRLIFIAAVAYVGGWRKVQAVASGETISIETHACEVLEESARCFSEQSTVFRDPNQRERAKRIAQRVGRQLESRCPLGFGDLEMAVVFENTCPNNSLPILWSEMSNPRWLPLFKRT